MNHEIDAGKLALREPEDFTPGLDIPDRLSRGFPTEAPDKKTLPGILSEYSRAL